MALPPEQLAKSQKIIEAALMVAGTPLTPAALQKLFDEGEKPDIADIRLVLKNLVERYADSGIELHEVASGWQFRSRVEFAPWLARLSEERPQRYSRALLETLALIAYRQPITRAEIEEVRGVAVSTHITRTLLERDWIRVIGHRDVPGKPALFGTTKAFLDHFSLKSLNHLPPLPTPHTTEEEEKTTTHTVQLTLTNTATEEANPAFNEANEINETEINDDKKTDHTHGAHGVEGTDSPHHDSSKEESNNILHQEITENRSE